MQVNVLTFGQITEIVNKTSFTLEGIEDLDSLRHLLENEFKDLKEIKYAVALDKKIVNTNARLQNNCVVALLPPFSGG